jgi:hypothetical protein
MELASSPMRIVEKLDAAVTHPVMAQGNLNLQDIILRQLRRLVPKRSQVTFPFA